eukprot:3388870-Prymnesium_polylepis.1
MSGLPARVTLTVGDHELRPSDAVFDSSTAASEVSLTPHLTPRTLWCLHTMRKTDSPVARASQ